MLASHVFLPHVVSIPVLPSPLEDQLGPIGSPELETLKYVGLVQGGRGRTGGFRGVVLGSLTLLDEGVLGGAGEAALDGGADGRGAGGARGGGEELTLHCCVWKISVEGRGFVSAGWALVVGGFRGFVKSEVGGSGHSLSRARLAGTFTALKVPGL